MDIKIFKKNVVVQLDKYIDTLQNKGQRPQCVALSGGSPKQNNFSNASCEKKFEKHCHKVKLF